MPNAMAHSEIHTHNYEEWILTEIIDIHGEKALRGRLTTIRSILRDGRQPERVSQPPIKE
ncbi:hypothetical protein [Thalassolituus oleivorans]|uniref:hypothetical protein n=1 Tax=Thalassolituus oleivorans TaxID=187493 RepID=UPI0030C8BF9D